MAASANLQRLGLKSDIKVLTVTLRVSYLDERFAILLPKTDPLGRITK